MKQMKMIILYIFQLEFILHIVGKHGTQYADLTIFSKFKMAAKKQNGCFKTIKESKSLNVSTNHPCLSDLDKNQHEHASHS